MTDDRKPSSGSDRTEPASRICPSCSAPNPIGSVRCSSCGEPLAERERTTAPHRPVTPVVTETEPTSPMIQAPNFTDSTVITGTGTTDDPSMSVAPRNQPGVLPQMPEEEKTKTELPAHVLQNAGNRLAGRYELIELLGEGGMGTVYHARDLELKEDIAIKLLQPHFVRNEVDVERFKREIITARRITHPNVIRIHDFGFTQRDAFISMELLRGGTLAQRTENGPPLSYDEALEIAIGIADGLGEAHRKGIIHRDIKPHNVMFDEHGVVKLLDFGIARLASAKSTTVGFTGTPYYMAPEQADAQNITTRSDVYSLGVLIYELVTGRLPFQSESIIKLALMHAHDPPPPPRSIKPDIPEGLERLILRCMAKKPEDRFDNALGVAGALREFHKEYSGSMELPLPTLADKEPPPRSRRRGLGIAVLLIAIGAVAVATWFAKPWTLLKADPTPVVGATPLFADSTPVPTTARLHIRVATESGRAVPFTAAVRDEQGTPVGTCFSRDGQPCSLPGGLAAGAYKVSVNAGKLSGSTAISVDPAQSTSAEARVTVAAPKVAIATPTAPPRTPVVHRTRRPAVSTPTPRPTPVVATTGQVVVTVYAFGTLRIGDQVRKFSGTVETFEVPANKAVTVEYKDRHGKRAKIRFKGTTRYRNSLRLQVRPGEKKQIGIEVLR